MVAAGTRSATEAALRMIRTGERIRHRPAIPRYAIPPGVDASMHLVLVNHYAGSPKHGMEFRPHQFARHWARAGHEVTVLAGSYSHLRNLNPEVSGRVTEEMIDGIRYRWLRTPRYSGNGLGRIRSIHAFVKAVDRERREHLRQLRIDAVIASSTYPFDIDPCRRIAREHQATLVWEVHDLWPLSPIELSGYSPRHPFIRVTQRAEDRCCRDAELAVTILPKAIDHLRTRGLDPDACIHVPNGAEPPGIATDDAPATAVREMRSDGRFTIVHAGGHGDYHGLDTLILALNELPAQRFGLVTIGEGPAKNRLRALADGLDNVHAQFVDRVDRASALSAMKESDAVYAGLRGHPIYRFGIGLNKIYDAMLCGRPIIASYTAGNDPVTEADCGIRVEADDAASLANGIHRLASLTERRRDELGANGRRHVREHHDLESLSRRLLEAIRAARGDRRGRH